ncbi:THO complex subunit 2 [Aphelenchoides fujianensis]|nr:THO complex subunit 2 [Aphelenchoides fujianensis]
MNGTAASLHRELLAVCSSVVGGSVSTADGIRTIRKQFLQKDERTNQRPLRRDHRPSRRRRPPSSQKRKEFFAAVASQFLPEDVLKLEVPQMGSDSKEAKARVIKAKTKIYYKQLKFNLFREENEGYSKLVTELMSVEPTDDPAALFSRISKLIGTFNLDPNRAVDVILDCFSCNTTCHKVYIGLLKALNFEAEVVKKINAEHTSNSFYRVVVMLCAFGMLDILEIFAAVHPPQRELVERMEELKKVTAKRVSKASTISTVAAAAVDGRNAVNSGLDDGHPAASSSQSGPPARPFSSVVYAQDLDDRKECGEFFDESLNLSQNQKLGLLMGALEVGSWSIALKLFRLFPDGFPLALLRSVAVSLGDILEYVLEPFYLQKMTPAWPDRSLDPKSWEEKFFEKPDRMTKWEDLKTRVLPILHVLGPYLGYHREVGEKLIRILATFFEDEKAQAEANSQEMSNLIFRIVDFCLLPSVSLIEPSYTYVDELWTIVSRLPYDKRYMMYGRWKGVHSKECHGLLVQAGKVTGQMNYVMKRLNKENVSMCGRHLGKISLSHPTVAFDYLLERLQQFDNPDRADSLIESLADPLKQTLKTSDGTLSKWLQALASFSGAVYRRYNVEYEGLLQYIANQLKDKKSFDLMVLREVLTATTGFEPLQSLTGDQLDALCSGDQIRQEVIGRLNGHQKGRRQAISRLRDALLHTDLCEQLAFLLAQQKNCVVFIETKEAPAKLASQILDQCQETFLQYVSFVRSHVKDDEYRERIPTVEVLLKTCNLPPEAAFHLARSKYLCRAIELDKTKESGFWTDLSCHVYAIFWLDIYVPTELYEKEIERVRREAAEAPKSSDHSKSRRTKDDDRSRAEQKLSSEFSRQKEHVKRSKEFLIHVKDQLFAQSTTCKPLSFVPPFNSAATRLRLPAPPLVLLAG